MVCFVNYSLFTPANPQMAVITELGSPTDPNSGNLAKIKFMVRHAGQYRITVMVGNHHVAGSPFLREFTAGPVDAQRTVVLRHCSTLVCTASVAHVLYIEPRDEYSNVCTYDKDANPTQVGNEIWVPQNCSVEGLKCICVQSA